MNKELLIGTIIAIAGFAIIGGLYYGLYLEHIELQQHYEWALEMSKLSPQDRDDITEEIHKLPHMPSI